MCVSKVHSIQAKFNTAEDFCVRIVFVPVFQKKRQDERGGERIGQRGNKERGFCCVAKYL